MLKYKELFDTNSNINNVEDVEKEFLNRLTVIIENNISDPKFNVDFVCTSIGMNQINLNKKLKEITGQTANGFIKDVKLKKAARMLTMNKYTISEITYAVGFNDLKYFRELFHKKFGVLPSDYKKTNNLNFE